VIKEAYRLYEQLAARSDVTRGDGLQRALRDCGAFFESAIGRAGAEALTTSGDLRIPLLRLAQTLRAALAAGEETAGAPPAAATALPAGSETLPQPRAAPTVAGLPDVPAVLEELLRDVEGTLARMQVQQVHARSSQEGAGAAFYLMELPVRSHDGVDLFHLRIARERAAAGDTDSARWTVTLAFELEALGPVRVRVSLLRERVSAVFFAERQDTQTLIAAHLTALREKLAQAGLPIGHLESVRGRPAAAPPSAALRLLDERG
jgi:hypothetical protein